MFFCIPERLIIRVTGNDRLRYLNGQVTNDLKRLIPGEAMQACVLTPKGKLSAVIWVMLLDDSILLEAPMELAEELPARLERYLVADDVVLEIISAEPTVHIFGELLHDVALQEVSGTWIQRLHLPGKDVKVSELPSDFFKNHQPLSEDCLEILRIEQVVPKWGRELTSDRLPPEAHLDKYAIDYSKGCYVGQEVISRLQSVGHVNRLLASFITSNKGEEISELTAGMKLFSLEQPDKAIGFTTSVAQEANSGKFIALGYVSRDNALPGKELLARDESAKKTCRVVVRK